MDFQKTKRNMVFLLVTLLVPLTAFYFSKSYGENLFFAYSIGIFLLVGVGLYYLEIENILSRTIVHILLTTAIEKYALYNMIELSAKKMYSLPKDIVIYQFTVALIWAILSYREKWENKKINYLQEITEGIFIVLPLILLRRDGGMTYFYTLIIIGNFWMYKTGKKISKERKRANALAGISLIMISLSVYFGEKSQYTKEQYIQYIQYIFVFLCLSFGAVRDKNWREIKKVFWISCLLPISLAAVQLLGNHFTIGRMCNVYNISSYSFLVLAMTTISLYMVVFENDWKFLLFLPILYTMVLFSGTRMIWIVTLIMTIVVLLFSLQWKVYVFAVILCLGGYFGYQRLPYENELKQRILSISRYKTIGSSAIRLLMWKEAYKQFLDKPFLGNGYVSYMKVASRRYPLESVRKEDENYLEEVDAYHSSSLYHSHSNFFELLSGTGLLGMGAFYSFQFYVFFIFMMYRWKKGKRAYCDVGILILGAYHLYSITDVTLFMEKPSMVMMVTEALLLSSVTKAKREH